MGVDQIYALAGDDFVKGGSDGDKITLPIGAFAHKVTKL
jgi:hypothetical protein